MTAKLDAMGHWWIAKLAQDNFAIHYKSGKMNVEAYALFWIPWDQVITAESVQAILKAAIDGPEALAEVYACSTWVCDIWRVEPPQ